MTRLYGMLVRYRIGEVMYVRTSVFIAVMPISAVLALLSGCNTQEAGESPASDRESVEQAFLDNLGEALGGTDAGNREALINQGEFSCEHSLPADFMAESQLNFTYEEAQAVWHSAREAGLCG